MIALSCLILAKVANVSIPIILKQIIDNLDDKSQWLVLPISLLIAYGLLKLASALFNELRDVLFAKVRYRAMRRISEKVLTHLHNLSINYHLQRKTGAISRDIERGTRSVSTLMNYMVFNIIPICVEFSLIGFILFFQYPPQYVLVILLTVIIYIMVTIKISNWRMHFRHDMNELDSKANSHAIDSLINFETVKYFGNEQYEVSRYLETLQQWENKAVLSQTSMSALNFLQSGIIALGVTVIMTFAAHGVTQGELSIGDLVLVNVLLLQLFIPLNFLGIVYRQIKYSLADMDLMFRLLNKTPEINDHINAKNLKIKQGEVIFNHVNFYYQAERQILFDIHFQIKPGSKLAIVGASGSGKSTLIRLLFRLYDVIKGEILIDGQNIQQVTQRSLRQVIGIVPQDTVLFNESIFYNIQYAEPDANYEDIIEAAKMANIHDFIISLPQGYDTVVGERGLKLSGGEKQRIAIARVILKKPALLIFDEATSALDTHTESQIQKALSRIAKGRTTLVIAHRLSTIVDADTILVMDKGKIIESGTHSELISTLGAYQKMWALQQKET